MLYSQIERYNLFYQRRAERGRLIIYDAISCNMIMTPPPCMIEISVLTRIRNHLIAVGQIFGSAFLIYKIIDIYVHAESDRSAQGSQ